MIAKNVGLTGGFFYRQDHTSFKQEGFGGTESTDSDGDEFGLRFGIAAFVF